LHKPATQAAEHHKSPYPAYPKTNFPSSRQEDPHNYPKMRQALISLATLSNPLTLGNRNVNVGTL